MFGKYVVAENAAFPVSAVEFASSFFRKQLETNSLYYFLASLIVHKNCDSTQ
jgi:hypothetical protein